ncbi:polysaccharide deacetylase family protein [Cecembia rubra]|nr:polysaccharide deacetylase family protein [Cecembia rubra]
MFTYSLLYFLLSWMTTVPQPSMEEPPQKSNEVVEIEITETKPRLAISFDDGNTADMPGYSLDEWDGLILQHLEKYGAKAIFFATGGQLNSQRGRNLLEKWVQSGHYLGNHTYTHPSFNSEEVSLEDYKRDFLKNNPFLSKFDNFVPFFRFPYLKEGQTIEKRDGFRKFLEENGYRNGHVTIDGSDWYINSRLLGRLKRNPNADISDFRDWYVKHHVERANFNDSLATVLTDRKVSHVLLLHHNFAASLFLGDLLEALTAEGWEIVDAMEAYEDPIYQHQPKTLPAGGNFLRALSKEAGIYGSLFAHAPEREGYLKNKMDYLGL